MEIRQLRIFMKVCETMNFTRAAKELSYAQSTVSDTIQALERNLEIRLFDRIGKKIYLTSRGKELYEKGDKLIQRYDTLMNDLKSGHESIRIGLTETLCSYKFPDFFRTFLEKEENVEFQFKILRCEEIPDCLRKNEIDIAYTLDEPFEYDDLITHLLSDEEIVAVSSKEDDTIEKRNIIIPEGETGYLKVFWEFVRKQNIDIGLVTNIESIEGIKNYVKSGFGISFMPLTTVQKEIDEGLLYVIPMSNKFYHEVKIWIHKDKYVSNALNKLIKDTIDLYQEDR